MGDVVIGKLASKVKESKRFTIFDRDSLNMILAEKDLAEADLRGGQVGRQQQSRLKWLEVDPARAVPVGRLRCPMSTAPRPRPQPLCDPRELPTHNKPPT